ncbi:DNA-binding transcriptional LysR family regulator [Kibdelosporangium banguiense]|uniref:DNA-binding transcriptional LysR family regulator n=1 Tax=Kibdelosporangium banguiense TaxID=1365924 RepID=A0ABS4TA92_9PSEU|nr:LysR family transcriptional regulator [Kibdelosporangium banguiense]MBP2321344.1 DNA-binding transcriptional LysR family regulator [Kibdelosporangium banguiense]
MIISNTDVMTLDEIETFVCIAEVGGFTEASRRLHRSQPAVSRRIHELEQSLDAVLFERAGRRVTLTEAGRALLPYAEAALAAVRDGERAVRDRTVGALTFRLAIVGTLADSHIVDALRAFTARFDEVTVDLRTATSREVSALVRSGEADLGLRYHPDTDPKLESIPLGDEKLYVIVPPAHRITAAELPDLLPLRDEKWLGFPAERGKQGSFRNLLERHLAAAGLQHPQITTVDSLTAQKRLVEAGLGVALMPVSSVREELRIGSLRMIDVPSMNARIPVVAVRRIAGHQSQAATAFLQVLADHTPDLVEKG